MPAVGRGAGRLGIAGLALAAALHATAGNAAGLAVDAVRDIDVKVGLIYNFARFADWPALAPGAPIVFCVVGSEPIAAALAVTVRQKRIGEHALDVSQPSGSTEWGQCSLLFIADAATRRAAAGLSALRTLPVLTVSDATGFARAGGIIELYIEGGRMRFAINVDAAELSGLHLSSRLLGLAKVVRGLPAR
jgi:hypothetical protein